MMTTIASPLDELRTSIIRYITFAVAPLAAFALWRTINIDPVSLPRSLLLLMIGLLCTWLYKSAQQRPQLTKHLFFGGTNLIFAVLLFLYNHPLLPFFSTFVIFISSLILIRGELFSALAVALTSIYLEFFQEHDYSLILLGVHLISSVCFSWLVFKTLSTAIQWYSLMYQQTSTLLEDTRNQRATLASTLKSLEIAYITQQQIRQDLILARKQAEEARRLKEQFAANISHELRTPLNLILGFSEVMYFSPEVYGAVNWAPLLTRDVNQIYRSSRHLMDMIDDILDLSYFEQASFTIERQAVQFSSFMQETAELAHNLFKSSQLQFEAAIDPGLLAIEIDSTRIRQVILNLINNARRFTDEGRVCLEAKTVEEGVQVSVIDSGIGIPAEQLPRVFDEYYQVDYSLSRKYGGAGLGLAISKKFVEAHGGRIWASSEVGVGSTFTFEIPVTKQDKQTVAFALSEAESVMVAPIRLLTVGDVMPPHEHFELYHVADVSDIESAIKMYQPRAILESDLHEPSLQSLDISIPIISCKISRTFDIRRHHDLLGCLSKPVTLRDISDNISTLTGIKTVMVIDDDPNFGQLMERFLHSIDHNIVVTRTLDGYDALQRMQNNPPDLALIDLVLPELNGLEIIEIMRTTPKLADTCVLLLTAANDSADLRPADFSQFTLTLPDNNFPFEIFECIHATTRAVKQRYR